MQTTSIRTMFRLDGRIYSEILVSVKETGEQFAYEIRKDHDGSLYCDMDGSRYDLTERDVKKLGQLIRELRMDAEGDGTTDRSRRPGRSAGRKRSGKKR